MHSMNVEKIIFICATALAHLLILFINILGKYSLFVMYLKLISHRKNYTTLSPAYKMLNNIIYNNYIKTK